MAHPSFNKGQVFLAMVFFIGGILAITGLLIAFLASSAADTGYGVAATASAGAAASAGAEDALLRLDRNPQFPSNGGTSPYTFSSGSSTATVTVTQNSPATGQVTILSASTVSGHTQKINVVVVEDPVTTQVNVISWTQIQ